MAHSGARAAATLAAGLVLMAISGCFGGDDGNGDGVRVSTIDTRIEDHVKVERVVYSSPDGRRVPALFATPLGVSPRGCLIWQNGLSSRNQNAPEIWDGAARLGLAVFSAGLRPRGSVRGSVADLRTAVDYLERRPDCRKNIGFGGLGAGGMIGSVVAGGDPRIRATVLMSTPPTWRERTLAPLDPVRWIPRISPRPVLVLAGRRDPKIVAALRPPKRMVVYRGGRAPFKGPDADSNDFEIASFLLRWLVKPSYSS